MFNIGIVLSWLGIFLTILIGWKSISTAFNVQYKKKTVEEQLDKAYLPIFRIMEPYLYKDLKEINIDDLKAAMRAVQEIIDKEYKYIRSGIVYWNEKILRDLDNAKYEKQIDQWYKEYCWRIDTEFEKARKQLFLPTRTLAYKINKNQFKNKESLYWGIFRNSFFELLIIIVISTLMIILLNY